VRGRILHPVTHFRIPFSISTPFPRRRIWQLSWFVQLSCHIQSRFMTIGRPRWFVQRSRKLLWIWEWDTEKYAILGFSFITLKRNSYVSPKIKGLGLGLPESASLSQSLKKQEARLLLGMADRTGPVLKLSYLWELVWQPSWELDICPDWLSWSFIDWLPIVRQHSTAPC